jgi:hypothetical protein
MKLLIATLLSTVTFTAVAEASSAPCANFAKYGAIREYRKDVPQGQGSTDMRYGAELVRSTGQNYEYLVTILDSDEDAETWEVDYSVLVRRAGSACKVLSVKQVATRNL